MTCAHQAYPGRQRLKLRKEQGTTACLEKAQSSEVVVAAEGQSKTCMVKATLLEPQSPVILLVIVSQNDCRGTPRQPTPHIARRSRCQTYSAHLLYGRARRRKGHLNTSNLFSRVITGCPIAGAGLDWRPVWVRSRHITQMPGPTTGTAATDTADGHAYKGGATQLKAPLTGGRAAVSTTGPTDGEAC